ncbi:GGDEF domain-containing protein [Aureimonas sp. SA4125]|uniref:putative bifunctional diguanylate cyclase/phosphodiesterase n=1 Tax=Aureimonas sp. SA4125 TaxID=2826993 RepID=UPI001CC799F4|nr:EAL domain-containing protein [Aureimonas sp. SA4125]BDA83796.1 GGDEF domain-containing protein [Aureimonas sp. SA4125]
MPIDHPAAVLGPAIRVDGETRLASADPAKNDPIGRIVRSSAYATECPSAAFYRIEKEGYTQEASFDWDVPFSERVIGSLRAHAAASENQVLIVNNLLQEPRLGDLCADPDGAPSALRFLAAVPVADAKGLVRGILIVADRFPQAGLSAAKTYVLRSHAADIALLLDLEALQQSSVTGDLSRRRETERLRLLESVVVNANDAILITKAEPIDQPGPEIVYCNAAFTRTTGYTEAEVVGLTPRILQSINTDRQALDRLRAALSAWKPIEVELLNTRKDGTEFWVELSIAPVANEKGWFTHWVSVQRDVSDRKVLEETTTRARIVEAQNASLEAEIQERKDVEARLLYTASHDDLTKLHNRAYFVERVTAAIQRTTADPAYRSAVIFMDIDRFKLVNDSLGHRAGDLLLMEIADRLRSCIGMEDTLARVGGDEFALLVEGDGALAAAIGIAERVNEVMREPIWLGAQEIFSSCSMGIVEAAPRHRFPEEFVRDADIAMYRAKRTGAGSYAVFVEEMHSAAVEALEKQTDLQNAVSRGEFFLQFQPIWAAASLRLTGMEALVRWQHPQRGTVPPSEFIDVAARSGLIRDIGRWVLSEACARARDWQQRFPNSPLRLSVNTSTPELKDPDFLLGLQETLALTGLSANDLQIEITEGVFIEEGDFVDGILAGIRALGVRIALDDFGTGFSSLSYLDRFPLDAIKIDQSFVRKMLTGSRTLAIVETIVRLGQILDLDIIAEGVEEEEQLSLLSRIGCNSVQGYLLGKPLSSTDFEALLARQ